MSEQTDEPRFSYVIRLGVPEGAPSVEVDHGDDLAVGRFATIVLSERLVVPFADECELVLAAGSELRGIVVEKETALPGDEDPNEAAFRVVREVAGGRRR